MRDLIFCTLLASLCACGDDGGAADSSTGGPTGGPGDATTGSSTTSGEPTSSTSTGSTGAPTTGGESSTEVGTASSGADTSSGGMSSSSSTGEASSTGDTSSSTGDTTGGDGGLSIAIVDAELWAPCGVGRDPDPVEGSWFVEFDNSAGGEPTSATLNKASLSLLDADPPVIEAIAVDPVESGPIEAGGFVSIEVKKLDGEAHSACDHCGEFYLLALEYQEGDILHQVTEEVTISCDF